MDILQLPYAQRQLIVVQDDEVAKAAREAEKSQGVAGSGEAVLDTILAAAQHPFPIPNLAYEAMKAWKRARDEGLLDLTVGLSEAKQLVFPPGHPRFECVYTGDPERPTHYFPLATFHRVVFEQKVAEAIRLLMSLGARTMRIQHVSGWSSDFAAKLNVGIPGKSAGVHGGSNKASESDILFEAELTGHDKPRVPDGLVWYEHEPTWKMVADGRVEYGLKSFGLTVTYQDDFGVNAALKARIQKAGLDLGGEFEDHRSTIWRISGTFGPES